MLAKKWYSLCLIFFVVSSLLVPAAFAEPDPQDEANIRTTFQTNSGYDAAHDIQTDAVMVFPDSLEKAENLVKSWQNKGYQVDAMLSISHDWAGDYAHGQYDGKSHQDEVQTDKEGHPFMHPTPGTGYMVPTHEWNEYVYEFARRSIEAGAKRIIFEEPEFWNMAGYSAAFKREWKDYYGEAWVDPSTSVSASYKSEQLKSYLYKRAVNEISTKIKENYPEVGVLVASHSTVNYNNYGIVALNAAMYDLPNVDGFIGQTWSDTAKFPVTYAGKSQERLFESAYLEYSSLSLLQQDGDGKDLYALADPASDNPAYGWPELEHTYKQTVSAQLLQPKIQKFQVLPWSVRAFAPAPMDYKSEQMNVYQALKSISGQPVEIKAGTQGITMLISDTITWENGSGARKGMESVFGPAVPLIERGLPVQTLPVERLSAEALQDTKVLIMSYDNWKPVEEQYNQVIAEWVKKGGVLVYLGGSNPYQQVDGWWMSEGLSSPQEDLWNRLNLKIEPESESQVTVGEKMAALTPSEGGIAISGMEALQIPRKFSITSHVLAGAKTLYSFQNQAVAFEQGVDQGHVIVFGVEPGYFASSQQSAELIRQLSRYALNKAGSSYVESNTLTAVRGPYVSVQSLAEPARITGKYLDLYDPRLNVITQTEMLPYTASLLLDISKAIKPKPGILFANGEIVEETQKMYETSYVIEGPKDTQASARIGSSQRYPLDVQASDLSGQPIKVHWEWDNGSKTLLIRHGHEPEGVKVTVRWSDHWIEDSVRSDLKEVTIPFNNDGLDLPYIYSINGPNGALDNMRFVDATGEMILKLDMNKYPDANLFLELANNFVVSASPDGQNWTEVLNAMDLFGADIHDVTNRSKFALDSKPYTSSKGELFIKLEDGSKQDGWGAAIYGIHFKYEAPLEPINMYTKSWAPIRIVQGQSQTLPLLVTNQSGTAQDVSIQSLPIRGTQQFVSFVPGTDGEFDYLYKDSGSGINPGNFRFADGNHYFVYRLSAPAGAEQVKLTLDLANQYEISLSADGDNWQVVDAESDVITDNSNRENKSYMVDDYLNGNREFYVKIGDSHKSGGHGGLLSKLTLSGDVDFSTQVSFSNASLQLAANESKVVNLTIGADLEAPTGTFQQPLQFTFGDHSEIYPLPIEILMEQPLYHAVKAHAPVAADGQVSEGEWYSAEMEVSTASRMVRQFGKVWDVTNVGDLMSRYQIQWDDQYLYVLEQRQDDSLNFTDTGSKMYLSDATMLFLDLNHDKSGTQYVSGDYAIMLTPSGPDSEPHAFLRQGDDSGVKEYPLTDVIMGSSIEGNTYTMEAAIPWSSLQTIPFGPAEGVRAGMTILSTDNDGPGNWGQIMWVGDGDDQGKWADMEFTN